MLLRIRAKIITKAGKNQIAKDPSGAWKIWVSVPPVKGKANDRVIELVAQEFKTAKSNVAIAQGLRGKNKVIEVNL
ncbi:MAG: DUF167 domain-containing protein [Patescibacteria group bacterium]|jgi:hypothetical protein